MEDIRVRFGRVNFAPKNTLITCRKGDTIYFGISRYLHTDPNPLTKKEGKRVAMKRLKVAISEVAGTWVVDGSLYIHRSGLFGQVSVDEVNKLLSYFDDIDTICKSWRGNR
jgi:hypothetical protein